MTTALLVIDVQRALCSGEYEVADAKAVIGRINALIRQARGAGLPVVFVQHEEQSGPFAHGGEGWQLDPGLDALPTDLRVRKTASDSFHQTPLQAELEARQVRSLVICGFQSEFCVDATTRRALALGYPVTLVADGHSTMDNGILKAAQITAHHNLTLSNLDSFGPKVRAVRAAEVSLGA